MNNQPTQARRDRLRILIRCAVMIAAAFVLSLIKLYEAPYGGSFTLLSMMPIIVISCMYGIRWGLGSAFVYSVIQLILGIGDVAYVPTAPGIIACVLLDYLAAFTAVGIAGIFLSQKDNLASPRPILKGTLGAALALALRFASHVIVGAIIWHELTLVWYADDPTHIVHKYGPWLYSVIYNSTFMLPEFVCTVIVTPVVLKLMKNVKK